MILDDSDSKTPEIIDLFPQTRKEKRKRSTDQKDRVLKRKIGEVILGQRSFLKVHSEVLQTDFWFINEGLVNPQDPPKSWKRANRFSKRWRSCSGKINKYGDWRLETGDGRPNEMGQRIEKFEDLEVWKQGIQLATEVYANLSRCHDYGLRHQMQRAAVSIPSNIAEGYERKSNKEFIQYLYISKGSCAELRTQTYIAIHTGTLNKIVAGN
jgi:four helix bundle protein